MSNLMRLIRKRLVEALRDIVRSQVLGKRGEGRPSIPLVPAEPEEPIGFICVPCSDDSLYSWGTPYLGLEPLGTPLTSAAQDDCSYNQYRLSEVGQPIVYDQPRMGGTRWKRNGGKTLSWGGVSGWQGQASLPAGVNTQPVYYDGEVIVSYSRNILAASTDDVYIYVLAQQGDIMYVARQLVLTWDNPPYSQAGVWEESAGFFAPGNWREGDSILGAGTSDINSSCNQAVVVSPQLVSGTIYDGEVQYIAFTVDWDAALATTITIINDSENNFSHTEQPQDPMFEFGAPCDDECGVHCFQRLFDLPLSYREVFSDWRYTGHGEFVVKAYYAEDTDDIVTTTVDIDMVEQGAGSHAYFYDWYNPGDGLWSGTGYSEDANPVITQTTTITIREGDLAPVAYETYFYETDYNMYWDKTWDAASGQTCYSPDPSAVGTSSFTTNEIKNELRMPARHRQFPIDGVFLQTVTVWSRTTSTTGDNAYCNGTGGDPACTIGFTENNSDDTVEEQVMRERIIDTRETLYDETYTSLPAGKGAPVITDDLLYFYARYYDEETFSYKDSMRHIANRSLGNLWAGITISDNSHYDMAFLPGATVANLYPPESGLSTNEFKVVWSGGDLLGAIGVPPTGTRRRINYWKRLGIGIIG